MKKVRKSSVAALSLTATRLSGVGGAAWGKLQKLQGFGRRRLGAARAWVYHQIHGEIGVKKLRDKICGDSCPPVGSGVTNHVVIPTILNSGNSSLVGHR
jgi:hypothetical protein